jgi:hypothetical protein
MRIAFRRRASPATAGTLDPVGDDEEDGEEHKREDADGEGAFGTHAPAR